jgi:uncharacterized damage-inducible protein DinB
MTLKDAIAFHRWATERTLVACATLEPEAYTKDLGNSFASLRDTLVHCLMADQAWLHRVQNKDFTRPDPIHFPNLEILKATWQPVLNAWEDQIATTAPTSSISYKTFDGSAFTSTFEEIVRHFVNHGSYHRGQIAMMLRLLGHTPATTDWIIFTRANPNTTK